MALLAAKHYDPATAVAKATDTLIAMTAVDTTNLRNTITAPANGAVLVRLKAVVTGATTFPRILLGVLDGSTVRMRMSTMGASLQTLATTLMAQEATGLITGLTPGNSYTLDAAYGVEIVVASTNIKYGGPDDATGADAWGGFSFEVWDTGNLLAGTLYDPSTSVSKAGTALKAMTALDTTNLRLTFTTNASGAGSTSVFWRVHGQFHGNATAGAWLLGVLDGATVRARAAATKATPSETGTSTSCTPLEAFGVITGLTANTSYTFDAAYGIQVVSSAGGLKYGGPDNATTNDAFGGIAFEIWAA